MVTDKTVQKFFDGESKRRDYWINRNSYYNRQLAGRYRFDIPEGSRVLELGCGTGYLLGALKPSYGVGVDFSSKMIDIATMKYPGIHFIQEDVHSYIPKEKFDFIIISDTLGYLDDIQQVFKNIKKGCTRDTRIIINSYNFVWQPALKTAEFLGLKMTQPFTSWISTRDIQNLLNLEGYDAIKTDLFMLVPFKIPILSNLINRYVARIPLINHLSLVQYVIARPSDLQTDKSTTVSYIVPARNEKGNIERIVNELPQMGKWSEIVFIEGGSKDNTWEEILRIQKKYKKTHKIVAVKQPGKGLADAQRKGFATAKGELMIIYNSDLTVPARDMTKFYDAYIAGKGEFLFGTRLVYPMEKEAMQTLNLIGNKFFAIVFSWILNQPMKDTLCGTKVITQRHYEVLKKNQSYFGDFDPFGDFDLIFGAAKQNLKFVEIPVRYKARTYGSTNISRFSHGWMLIKMVWFSLWKMKFI